MLNKKKILLASAVMISLSGVTAGAVTSPEIAGSGSGMSQSAMVNVKSGKVVNPVKPADITPGTDSVAVEQSQQTVAVGDASLYLSQEDDTAIAAQEGKTITKVDFKGVPEEVKHKLFPLLQSKPGSIATTELIRNDVASLGSTGVFSQISPEFSSVPEGIKIDYKLVSNPVVHQVKFSGNTIFTDKYLQSVMDVPQDSVLNFVLVNQKIRQIENLYLQQGYILVSIPTVQVTPDGILNIAIEEGRIEDISLVGNEKTKDKVILRELRFKKGQPFNKFLASRSMERLYNLGYFEDVNMKLLPGKYGDHNVIVEIDVVEQKTGIITVGAGYSESDGMVGVLEVGDTNFRGTGDKVNVHWEFGGSGRGRNYQLSYTRPWINSNGDSLGASVFNRVYQYNDYNAKGETIAEYDKRRQGWNLTWGRVSDEYRTNYLNFESVKESYDSKDGFQWGGVAREAFSKDYAKKGFTTPQAMEQDWYNKIQNNFGRTNSLTFTHVFDNRDNYFNASRGRRLSYSLQWGGHGLGGKYDFYKVTAEGRFYKSLRNGHILALRLMGGYINGDVAYGNLFDLGGANTLRGYEDEQFKGNKMYAATLEYRFPIAKKVQGVVFTDMGSTWGIDNGQIPWYEDDTSIHFSAGVGIRLQTPIGPIRLDYGHGDRNKFHFSFGTQF